MDIHTDKLATEGLLQPFGKASHFKTHQMFGECVQIISEQEKSHNKPIFFPMVAVHRDNAIKAG